MLITGIEPMSNKMVYDKRGPKVSHNRPMMSLATIVADTEAMVMFPICSFVRCNVSRTIGIKGAMPNHPKKHTKNVSQVI
jgi:hypothetical protein